MNRKRIVIALSLLALITGVLVASLQPGESWRVGLIRLKLGGELELVSWGEILRGLVNRHQRYIDDTPVDLGPAGLLTGSVTFDQAPVGAECQVRWHTPVGPLWGRLADDPVLEYLLHEQTHRQIYLNDLVDVEEGDVVLDVGGHLGTFTAAALRRGAGLVVAFEPLPGNIACFKLSFEKELRDGRVVLVEAAAWDRPDTLEFALPEFGNTGAGKVKPGGQIEVPAVTIDEVVAELGLERVDFIKMDIEGSERQALTGARETISRFGPSLALSVYHHPEDPEIISEIVLEARPEYESTTRAKKSSKFSYFY